MRKSASKKTLLASAAALSLSALLFAGTTYAWFTDSASSAASTLTAGNLKASFEVWNGEKYVTVTDDTDVFKALDNGQTGVWEPGHAEVVYLKVTNTGSLALKYKLAITSAETEGINVDGNSFKLSENLVFGLISTNEQVLYTNRADAVAAAGTNAKSLSDYSDQQVLYPSSTEGKVSEQYVALVVYMPESVGNTANYKTGTAAPTIKLGLNLTATQTPYENDSFSDDYDNSAVYPAGKTVDLSSTLSSAAAGQTVTVSGNAELTGTTAENVTIKGDGAENTTLIVDGSNTENSKEGDGYKITSDGTTISNVTIQAENIISGNADDAGNMNSVINVKANNVVLDGVVVTGGGQWTNNSSILLQNQTPGTDGGNFTISNSTVSGAFRAIYAVSQKGNITIDNCDLDAVYPININGGSSTTTLTVTGSKFHGWTSFAAIKQATFTDTEFSKGNNPYDHIRPYSDTTFTNCSFDADLTMDTGTQGITLTFVNCTKDGQDLTADNFKELFGNGDKSFWNTNTVIVNGITVTPDTVDTVTDAA
jgi:predicted ribosomally synthesized peptide with SipW-like signal peptide